MSSMGSTPTSSLSLSALFGVEKRVVLVTGGGSGLGSYAAVALALHGAQVYIVGRRKDKLDGVVADFSARQKEAAAAGSSSSGGQFPAAATGKVVALQGDVASKDGISAIRAAFEKHEAHLDLLVNAAGIMKAMKASSVDKNDGLAQVQALWDEPWDVFQDTHNVNLTAVFYVAVAFAPLLARAAPASHTEQGPQIVNVTSIAAFHLARPASVHYQTSKDAAEKLTKILAGRLQPLGIRVNAISPGIYPSEMTQTATAADFSRPDNPLRAAVERNPIKRSGTPEDFAGLIVFLASRAGAYFDGTSLTTDGGRLLNISAA